MRLLPLVAICSLASCGSLAYYDPSKDADATDRPETGVPPGDDDDDFTPGDDDDDATGPVEDCLLPGDEDGDGDADCADPDCATTCDADDDGAIAEGLGGDDCDDTNPDVNPSAFDDCDNFDDDCDGFQDEGDADNDSADSCDDCDDLDPYRFPGAPEVCDGVDSDCDQADCFEFSEGFESGALTADWVGGGSANWAATTVDVYAGTYSAKSANIGDGQASSTSLTLTFAAPGEVSFWHTGTSEACCDFFQFSVDGILEQEWSGNWGWTQATFPVAAGVHTLRWRYIKDGSQTNNPDRAVIDDVVATGGAL